jgi:hypothetical protein
VFFVCVYMVCIERAQYHVFSVSMLTALRLWVLIPED